MKQTVKFIRVIGGQDDGAMLKIEKPWEVDAGEVRHIVADGERYKLDHIVNETAVFVHDGFVA